jgi:hypothetical protein
MQKQVSLRLDVKCEVDDLGGRLTDGNALYLAVLRVLNRIVRGDIEADVFSVEANDTPLVEAGQVVGSMNLQFL